MNPFLPRKAVAFAIVALAALPNINAQEAAGRLPEHLAVRLDALRTRPLTSSEPVAHAFFAELDEKSLRQAIAWLDAAPPDPAILGLTKLAMRRWGELAGRTAHANARSRSSAMKPSLESAVLAGWALSDPEAAWMAMMQISNRGADRRYNQLDVLVRIAEADLNLALEYFEDLVPDRTCLECTGISLASIAYHQGRMPVVADRVASMPDGPFRNALRHGYWHIYGWFDPASAVELLQTVQPDEIRRARRSLCSGWASGDLEACLAYIQSTATADERPDLITTAVQEWAKGAVVEDVAAIITRLPGPLDERVLLGSAGALAAVNPQVTLEWIASQPETPIRTESLDRAMRVWARVEAVSAVEYVRSQEDVATRGTLLWTYLLVATQNHTLQRSDLELIDDRFNADWSARLLEHIAVRLVDPSSRGSSQPDRETFTAFVEGHTALSAEHKAKILKTLK